MQPVKIKMTILAEHLPIKIHYVDNFSCSEELLTYDVYRETFSNKTVIRTFTYWSFFVLNWKKTVIF